MKCRDFVYSVSAIFLLPVCPDVAEMAVVGLFSAIMRVLRCVVASKLAQSATGRQPITGILLPDPLNVNIRRRTVAGHPEYFSVVPRLSGC